MRYQVINFGLPKTYHIVFICFFLESSNAHAPAMPPNAWHKIRANINGTKNSMGGASVISESPTAAKSWPTNGANETRMPMTNDKTVDP